MKKIALCIVLLTGFGCGASNPEPVADETPIETQTQALETTEAEPERENPLDAPADVAEAPADAVRTPSGLAYKVLRKAPEGARQASTMSTVVAHYTGWTTDGERFDSSVERGEPAEFPLSAVIEGWKEGVGTMAEGEKRRFWIPEDLAYKGREGFPAGTLVFEVELITVK
jgi:peptidylprolyl isomerase